MTQRSSSTIALLLALCWQLAGCVSHLPATPATADFRMEGKIGVVEAGRAYSARFSWTQQGAKFAVDLWGPLGQGRTRLLGDGQRLLIINAKGEVLARGEPQALMQEHLGWSLPLNLLLDWLHGRPAASPPASARASGLDGRLTGFHQQGWRVRFEGFQPYREGLVPSRITAKKPGARVRVLVAKRI